MTRPPAATRRVNSRTRATTARSARGRRPVGSLAILTALLTIMLTGSPAHAGERDWRTTTACTTGDLSIASYDTPPDLIVIHGWAALCTAPPGGHTDAQFAVVNFYPDSPSRWTSVERRNLRRYANTAPIPAAAPASDSGLARRNLAKATSRGLNQ